MTTILALGGARSGKSVHAEHLLSDLGSVTYVAPGTPLVDDPEWSARIEVHRRRRPHTWTTAETTDVVGALDAAEAGTGVLVDCLGTWLTRLADDSGTWDDPAVAHAVWDEATTGLVAAVRRCRASLVLVSNETGLGVVPATSSGRLFRDAQGRLNARVADACDAVHLVVAGRVLDLGAAPRVGSSPTLTVPGRPA